MGSGCGDVAVAGEGTNVAASGVLVFGKRSVPTFFQEVGVIGYFFVAFTTVAFVELAVCSLGSLFATFFRFVPMVLMI